MAAMKIDAEQLEKDLQEDQGRIFHRLFDSQGEGGALRPDLRAGHLAIVISYYMIFLPPQKKLSGLQRRIDAGQSDRRLRRPIQGPARSAEFALQYPASRQRPRAAVADQRGFGFDEGRRHHLGLGGPAGGGHQPRLRYPAAEYFHFA